MPGSLLRRTHGHVLWLTINRAEKANALDDAVIGALTTALEEVQDDPAVRVVVLTGAGERVFCAGADLQPTSGVLASGTQAVHPYARLLRAGLDCPVPVVARVNGHALAGGLGLLGMCDLAVAADHARFGLPEVKVGLFPFMAAAALGELIPARLLRELALTGEPIDAARALEAGLVNDVVPAAELDARTAALLERLVAAAPLAVRRGKGALRAARTLPFDDALTHLGGELSALAQTQDAAEGLAAFRARRPPHWTGR